MVDSAITDSIKKIIENNPVALATVMPDGKPNVIGLACVKVIDKSRLLITDVYMKQTINDIYQNSNVVIVVWNKKMTGYKLIGKAQYFNKGKWFEKAKTVPENKNLSVKGAILININKIIKAAG